MTETNFTDRVLLRLNHTIPVIDKFAVIKKLWWFHDGNWDPEGFVNDPLPEHGAYITLTNSYATDPLNQLKGPLNLFTYTTDPPATDGDCDPLLAIDRGFTVKKDITAGGFVGSNQGEVWLGSGRDDQLDVPKIILMHADWSPISGGGWMEEYLEDIETIPNGSQFPTGKNGKVFRLLNSYEGHPSDSVYKYNGETSHWDFKGKASDIGKFDTLYLKKMQLIDDKIDTNAPAHLDLGDLTVEGQLRLQSANKKLFTLAAGDNGEADNYVYLTPIDPPNGGLGLGTYAHPFQWIDTYTVFTDAIMNLHPLPRLALLLRLLSTSRSSGMKQASALDAEETVEAIVIDNDEVAGLKQKHLNGLVDEWYSDDEVTLTAKVDGTTGSITANGGITLGTSPAAINFTTGYTTSEGTTYRYLIPDGADKTVGIGSTNHYLAYLSANRIYTNEILSLDAGYTIIGSALNANGTVGTAGQVLKSRGANLSPEWATASNPFNQSLNTTDNAIFNSVKGTDGAGALKAGDEMTLAWDGTYSYIAAHNKHMYLGTSSGKDVIVQRSLRVTDHPIWFTSSWSAHPDSDPSAAEISNDTTAYKALMIVGNSSRGSGRRVAVWDYLSISNAVTPQLSRGEGSALRVTTDYGYGDIGAQNGGYFHFTTDRPQYYFDHSISVNGPIQFYTTGAKLYSNAAGVIQVQDSSGYLGTLDASNVFVDHINSASGGGITFFDNVRGSLGISSANAGDVQTFHIHANNGLVNDRATFYMNHNASWVQQRALSLWYYPGDSLGGCCHDMQNWGIDSNGSNIITIFGNTTVNGGLTCSSVWINGSWLNSSSTLYIGGSSGAAVTMYMNGNVNPVGSNLGLGSGGNPWNGATIQNLYTNQTGSGVIGTSSYYWNASYVTNCYAKHGYSFGCEPKLSGQIWEREFKAKLDAEEFVKHELTKDRRHITYDLANEGKIICTCGKSVESPCPEHLEEWNDKYTIDIHRLLEATSHLTLEMNTEVNAHNNRITQLEKEIASLRQQLDALKN